MISIFNGRARALGGDISGVYVKMQVGFREHLNWFKGARLSVFLAIALHADQEGWAFPSYGLLARETGYGKDAIGRALADLCKLELDGHRVLLRYQPYDTEAKRWMSNRYLIFPSADEVTRYESDQCRHFPDTGKPDTGKPDTGNADTKKSHLEQDPSKAEPEKEEPAAAAGSSVEVICSLHNEPMELRRKGRDVWYSHRLPGGDWCKGTPDDVPGENWRDNGTERKRRYVGEGVLA